MKNRVCGWLCAILALAFSANCVWATEPDYEPRAVIRFSLAEPIKIGETRLIPVEIGYSPKWKSGLIKFELDTRLHLQVGVDPNSVKIGEIILDASRQAPYTAYVPVTVTGEGRFDIKGTITIEAPDGELFDNGLSTWTEPTNSLGVFAFEGEAFFSGTSSGAMDNMAYRNLQKNPEIAKQNQTNSLSKDQSGQINKIREDETNKLYKLYFKKYPILPPKSSLGRALKAPINKGYTVTLEVNFPTNSGYTSFLPLDGAEIVVADNNGSAVIASGTLNKGKFAFISPRDGLSFTAKVTA
jgi:hypothetical protein